MHWRVIDITGKRFARLVAVTYIRRGMWIFQCDCGRTAKVPSNEVRNGRRISCGCVLYRGDPDHPRRTHGMRHTPEYEVWKSMRARCKNPNDKRYARYGKRGISVCARWQDFSNFIQDMGPRPSDKHSLERRNNDGDYEPDNCYWGTDFDQGRNKKSNLLITHEGRTQCLSAWAAESSITPQHLRGRLRDGWEFADAIGLPVGSKRPRKRAVALVSTTPR